MVINSREENETDYTIILYMEEEEVKELKKYQNKRFIQSRRQK